MFVASFDDTTTIRSTTSASGISVPGAGMPSSRSSGSMRKSGAPGASERNVSALVSGVSSVTVPASSARATATRTASLTVDAA